MKHLIILLLFTVASSDIFSQGSLDLGNIKKAALDTTSKFSYYPLVEKFNSNPLVLNIPEGTVIYYGKLFTRGYKPYKINFDAIEFTKLFVKKKYKKAIPKGEEVIRTDPANLEILSKLSMCYKKAGLIDKSDFINSKVDLLISSILTYGSGQSKENTLKVISIGDEYAVMGMLGISGISRKSSVTAPSIIDRWAAKDKNGKRIDFFVEVLNNPQAFTSDK